MVNVFPNLASVLYPLLTLTALSLFYKLLPISNTGDSIAYILATVHFLYPKLGSFSNVEHYFYQLAYRCSPSFDWNWGKQNDPTACWYQLHLRFQVLQQGKCLRYRPEHVGGVTETTICLGGEGAAPPSNPLKTGGHPPLKFPRTRYLDQRAAEKAAIF